jgi:hypothetical protein
MSRSNPTISEGVLIIFVGIIGLMRVIGSFPDAGEFLTRMLYTLFFIFIGIALIGIKIIKDVLKKG